MEIRVALKSRHWRPPYRSHGMYENFELGSDYLVICAEMHHFEGTAARSCNFIFSARCNIYISRLCYDVSVRLSVRLSVCDGSAL